MTIQKPNSIVTDLQLRKLRPASKTYDVKVANVPGLIVRVGKTGSKSFRWDRGGKHKPRIITHGAYPAISLKEARQLHDKAKLQHALGTLQLEAAKKSLVANKPSMGVTDTPKTVRDLAEMFYVDYVTANHKRPEIARRVFDVDILPIIGEMKLLAVTPLTVRAVIKIVVDRGATVYARRVLTLLSQLFEFGVSYQVVEGNPAISLKPKMLRIESNIRDRKLLTSEIKMFWLMLEDYPTVSIQVRVALQLLLLLGIRSGELRQAEWSHVDLDKGLLTVPVKNQKLKIEQIKKAKDFIVPLNVFAISLFHQVEGLNSVWVFPGVSGDEPFSRNVMARTIRRVIMNEIEPFRPHDLRRTLRTNLSKLGVQPHIAERCLNHSLGTIIDTYDQYDYLDERREALERWSQRVQVILGKQGDSVIVMEGVA